MQIKDILMGDFRGDIFLLATCGMSTEAVNETSSILRLCIKLCACFCQKGIITNTPIIGIEKFHTPCSTPTAGVSLA